ncbi:MAG: aminopeptidase P N-terminal domain-containing protein [Bryobacteraceae bacterium]
MHIFRLVGAILIAAQGSVWAAAADVHRERRTALVKALPNAAIVLFGRTGQEGDGRSAFVQDSNFFYLTGWQEPGAVLLIAPPADILFFPPADERRERYYGKIADPQGFGAVLPPQKIESELRAALDRYPRLYTVGERAVARLKALAPLREVGNAAPALAALRMRKSPSELAAIEHATEVTIAAHREAWRRAAPGLYEYQLAATLMAAFLDRGCEGAAFPSIVGSGPAGLILHYWRNIRRMDAGELVVMDAAAQCGGYASDVTRTVPVNGLFTKRQREVYEVVLGAQKATIAAVKPGVTLADLTRVSREYMDAHGGYARYSAHGVSHHVGLDVHDGADNSVPLAEGMVITVEPGIYIPEEELAVRIEDTVLVTARGARVLSAGLPKEPREVERALAK